PQSGGALAVGLVGSTRLTNIGGGSLQALGELSAEGIPGVRAELDRLAAAIVTTVNAMHTTGVNPGGGTGVALFDPAGVTASTIAVSAAVSGDVMQIAAGLTGASGDNTIALQIAALRSQPMASLNGEAPGAFFAGLVANFGAI